jgi:ABC-2 type transport system permease protein
MYALRDYIGEDGINRALAKYIAQTAYQEPPYTHSPELIANLREVTPDSLAYVIEDMLETITLFSNRTRVARCRPQDDGRFLVQLEVEADKLRADGLGTETAVPIRDWIDIGVFGEQQIEGRREQTVLYLEKHHITQPRKTFEIVVDQRPVRAGIDPYNKLIDRDSNDNVRKVTHIAKPS